MNSAKRNREILAALEALYPDAGPELHFSNPYETLVATMLSAQSTDVQVNKVTPAVFRDFPTLEKMAEATPEILYPYVASCGFKSKATNIVQAARDIMARFGGQVPGTLEELTSLRGVGRKTANVVLANAFGVPAMAVDTHVFRVSNRLGLAEAAHAGHPEKTVEPGASLADLPWPPRVQGPEPGLRQLHASAPVCPSPGLRRACRVLYGLIDSRFIFLRGFCFDGDVSRFPLP